MLVLCTLILPFLGLVVVAYGWYQVGAVLLHIKYYGGVFGVLFTKFTQHEFCGYASLHSHEFMYILIWVRAGQPGQYVVTMLSQSLLLDLCVELFIFLKYKNNLQSCLLNTAV